MIGALCFGSLFGLPFVAWGIILIADRDRTWQKQQAQSNASPPRQRSRAWDRRQILYGALLIAFGAALIILLSLFNYAAQAVSPPAPF